MLKDHTCLIVESHVLIFIQVSLEHPIAAVQNHGFDTAAWAIDAVTPVNLSQQVRGSTLRENYLDWEPELLSIYNTLFHYEQ